ncbi:IclR family transcriptional regulator [Bradyrhizobium sp. BR 10261]|uniref:IclR family transcriptional regulator n=1 Tax=Bradyrhizobium sp. BR 10261 TaxID=2749992 RepID=UPI001C64700F|nr:IclR family transcriptional regulator [Bradyrhizobium sp. BR 10261]MBW7961441.1 IclR family transcriptional regulator [Bradyrhizobium sp. BR 10261]
MTSVDSSRQSVKSLFKMLEVLEAFSSTDPELSVVEIARRTSLPRTTVHRIVDSLRSVGFLEQDASRDRYRLGIKLFELGGSALTNLPLYREAPPFVDTLAKLSGEDVHLCIFDGAQMVFVNRRNQFARPHNTVITMEASPCHSTGVGKAALAFQSEAVIERVIRAGLARFTPNTIVEPKRLKTELAAIRTRGYSIDDCEHEPELRCVGAPIRNSTGRVFAAISVSGPTRRVTPERVPELARAVMTHAELLSIRLGYQPDLQSRTAAPLPERNTAKKSRRRTTAGATHDERSV